MKSFSEIPLRTKALVGVFLVLGIVYGSTLLHAQILKKDLLETVNVHIEEIKQEGNQVAYIPSVWKEYTVFGPTKGSVQIYIRPNTERDDVQVHSMTYFYAYKEGKWESDGFDAAASAEANEEGRKAFGLKPAAS